MNKLTVREEEIMHIFWDADKSLSAHDVIMIKPELSQNTVQVAMNKLINKKFIKISGVSYSGPALTRQYKPIISEADYYSTFVSKQGQKIMFANLISQTDDELDLDEIIKMAEQKKAELNQEKE